MQNPICNNGAGLKGEPQEELLGCLNSDSSQELNSQLSDQLKAIFADGSSLGGPSLAFANGMWVDQSRQLKKAFKELVVDAYQGDIDNVDFQTQPGRVRQEIKVWAENKTNGLIKNILPPHSIHELTRLVIRNAVYFKGTWKGRPFEGKPFEASNTKDKEFFLLDGSTVRAPFITCRANQQISVFDGFKVLRLPYEHGDDKRRFSMYFYLPDAKEGLPDFVEQFGSEPGFIKKHIPYSSVRVGEFRFPKFKIGFLFYASNDLVTLGLKSMFRSDLTEMVKPVDNYQGLFVDTIIHKSFIEVNEEGTEAAAVTMAAMCFGGGCGPIREVEKVDFVGTVLFVRQVLNPLAAED